MYDLADGIFAVKLARDAATSFIESEKKLTPPANYPRKFEEKSGVFVTLKTFKKLGEKIEKTLRGCIGFPYPNAPLIESIIDSAIASATQDSRFHPPFGPGPVSSAELSEIVFEVSILTPPQIVEVTNAEEYLGKIQVGRDGLIVERGRFKGLLLPQVPIEWNWNVREFLENTCNKAYMPIDCWKKPDIKIFTFQAFIFEEIEPFGEIQQKEIGDS